MILQRLPDPLMPGIIFLFYGLPIEGRLVILDSSPLCLPYLQTIVPSPLSVAADQSGAKDDGLGIRPLLPSWTLPAVLAVDYPSPLQLENVLYLLGSLSRFFAA
jgi:hypothetical protein